MRTREQNARDGFYPEYMTEDCRGCDRLGGHNSECPRYDPRPIVVEWVCPRCDLVGDEDTFKKESRK